LGSKKRVSFAHGRVESANFHNYGILTMSEAPDIEVHIVKSQSKLGGIGEPGVPPVAPAVDNAVCTATGIRIRRLPMTPELVMEAMKNE
jgi:isoquinoline 1-oxidoreductase beta subunit